MIFQLLNYICWGDCNDVISVNYALIYIYDIKFTVIKDAVPIVKIKANEFPHWYDYDVIKLVIGDF